MDTIQEKLSKALTWEEVANDYKRIYGGTPRIHPPDEIFDRLAKTKGFKISKEGTIHKIL